MAQTTNQVAQACGDVWVSADCDVWTLISGEAQSVDGTDQTRKSGEAYTFDGDTALVCGGKREPMELSFVLIYTEDAAEAYEIVRALFEAAGCGANMCVRWAPAGSGPDAEITSAQGVITNFIYPPIDASAGGCILAGFSIKVPYVTTTFGAT